MTENWSKCSFSVPTAFAETFAWLLAQSLDHPVEILDETTMTRHTPSDVQTVLACFDGSPPPELDQCTQEICQQLQIDGVPVHVEVLNDTSWKEGWKRFFEPQSIDGQLCVHAPWHNPTPHPYSIEIEPGLAFGTGTHETTRMMLSQMLKHLSGVPPTSVYDVGSGSGILSIAAEKFGHQVFGVEIDKVAVENALENLIRNQCSAIEFRSGTIEAQDKPRPWVLVNILAKIIIQIKDDIKRVSTDHLVLSGFLTTQRQELLSHFPEFRIIDETTLGPWGCVYLRRQA